MTILVHLQDEPEPLALTPLEFEQIMGVAYLSQLEFIAPLLHEKIDRRCAKEDQKKWIDPRQKWLGSYYSQEIRKASHPDVTIRWISPALGYGVFSNRAIPRHGYIGEYTGIVRKRHLFGRLKNLYCFDYTIGFGRATPYVIDAEKYGNFSRYINHSDNPNVETASVLCDGIMHMILYAITDIPEGSQLCCNYGEKYWEKREKPLVVDGM
jgi:uncharacterized protein